MNSPPSRGATADEHPQLSAANTRAGLVLFSIYLAFYGGFVLLAAFSPETMGRPALAGVNLAITYGMGLIFGAFVVAALYMGACAHNARRFAGRGGEERGA
jgi:uncharacterized membrane protein (DUF485 family)